EGEGQAPARHSPWARARPVEEMKIEKNLGAHEHAGDDGGEGEEVAEESVGESRGEADVAPGADVVEVDPGEDAPDENRGEAEEKEMVRSATERAVALAGENSLDEQEIADPDQRGHVEGDVARGETEVGVGRSGFAELADLGIAVKGGARGE